MPNEIHIRQPSRVSIHLERQNKPFKIINALATAPTDRTGIIQDEIIALENVVQTLQTQLAALEQRSTPFTMMFSQANLNVDDILPVVHGLNAEPGDVTVWDSSGDEIGPDDLENLSLNAIGVKLTSFVPLQGLYTIRVSL